MRGDFKVAEFRNRLKNSATSPYLLDSYRHDLVVCLQTSSVLHTRAKETTTMSKPELSALMTVKEAAEYLHVSTQTVRRWARDNLLRYVRLGKEYRIVRDSLPKFHVQQKNIEKS